MTTAIVDLYFTLLDLAREVSKREARKSDGSRTLPLRFIGGNIAALRKRLEKLHAIDKKNSLTRICLHDSFKTKGHRPSVTVYVIKLTYRIGDIYVIVIDPEIAPLPVLSNKLWESVWHIRGTPLPNFEEMANGNFG